MSRLFQFFNLPLVRLMSAGLSLLAYSPSYLALPAFLPVLYKGIFKHGRFFEFSVFTVVSYGLITVALVAVAIGALAINSHRRAFNWTQLALVLYWLPHAFVAGFWCELVDNTAWID